MCVCFYCRLGYHTYTWKQCRKKVHNTKWLVKKKFDGTWATGGGPADLKFTADENTMHHIMGEGSVLEGIEAGLDTEALDDDDEDDVEEGESGGSAAEPQPSSTAAKSTEPVSGTSGEGKSAAKLKPRTATVSQASKKTDQGMVFTTVEEAQQKIPHLKNYKVISDGMFILWYCLFK